MQFTMPPDSAPQKPRGKGKLKTQLGEKKRTKVKVEITILHDELTSIFPS